MTHDNILERIAQAVPGAVASSEEGYDGILNIETSREQVHALLQYLREDDELNYHFLTTLSTVHYPDNAGRELVMVYHLHNWPQNRRLRVKVGFPVSDPHLPTATNLWPTANWMERQEYDFFGVVFDGHPDLRRILNVEDLDVYPMRKEFRLEDGTRTDKDDRYFGRDGHEGRQFD